jgi:hypothetical protein
MEEDIKNLICTSKKPDTRDRTSVKKNYFEFHALRLEHTIAFVEPTHFHFPDDLY